MAKSKNKTNLKEIVQSTKNIAKDLQDKGRLAEFIADEIKKDVGKHTRTYTDLLMHNNKLLGDNVLESMQKFEKENNADINILMFTER